MTSAPSRVAMMVPSVLTSAVTPPSTRSFGYGSTAVCVT